VVPVPVLYSDKPHAFSNLIAGSDNEPASVGKLRITYMYSWWGQGVEERMPRMRFGKVHVFNSYYDSQRSDYLIGPGVQAQMVIENNLSAVNPEGVWINDGFDDGTSAYVATGNEGTAAGPLNRTKGTGVFSVPYPYELIAASEVEAVVASPTCGAGSSVTLAE
jgi:pectate lyase